MKRRWGTARVGLDGVAQRIVFGARAVELPQPGMKVHAGEVVGRVTCGDKHAAIASPVDGVVTAANEALSRNPSALHREPYREGWLAVRGEAGQLRLHLPAAWSFGTELVQCGGRSPEPIP